jgi:hypothetical protein
MRTIDRRKFVKLVGGAAGGAVALGSGGAFVRARRAEAQVSLKPFVDALPIPKVIAPDGRLDGDPFFQVTMQVFRRSSIATCRRPRSGATTASIPAPRSRRGAVADRGALDEQPAEPAHAADRQHAARRRAGRAGGADGRPSARPQGAPGATAIRAWFTNNFARTGPFFEQRTYHYPNDQAATQLWYHDHTLGATRINNYAGLQGVYLLRDRVEDNLNLPDGPFEIPLIIQDKFFNPDGSLLYPKEDNGGDPDPRVPPVWIPEFFGDTVLVNGRSGRSSRSSRKYLPHPERVERTLLSPHAEQARPDGTPKAPRARLHPDRHDGGFLPAPVLIPTSRSGGRALRRRHRLQRRRRQVVPMLTATRRRSRTATTSSRPT